MCAYLIALHERGLKDTAQPGYQDLALLACAPHKRSLTTRFHLVLVAVQVMLV